MSENLYDVAIVGGGPSGCTISAFLKKYHPSLKVIILERTHTSKTPFGQSLTPNVNAILKELELWDLIQQSDFALKFGTTYRFGKTPELWDIDCLPHALYEALKQDKTQAELKSHATFFVERTKFDSLLKEKSKSLGCEFRENTLVAQVNHQDSSEGPQIDSLELKTGETIQAQYYIDASGGVGLFRRALNLPTLSPFYFAHTFIWDNWQLKEPLAHQTPLRAQILSTPYGWFWLTPINPTQFCIGFACDTEFFNQSNKTPNRFYLHHVQNEPLFEAITTHAKREESIQTYQPHGLMAEKSVGPNWLLIGDAASEVDPLLQSGLSLAMTSAIQCAHTVGALLTNEHDSNWLMEYFDYFQKRRVLQHHRFITFWYTQNTQMSDIQPKIETLSQKTNLFAKKEEAMRWLSQDGFIQETTEQAGLGGFPLYNVKHLVEKFTDCILDWEINHKNVFSLNLTNDTEEQMPFYWRGKVKSIRCYRRGNKLLPDIGPYGALIRILQAECSIDTISEQLLSYFKEINLKQPTKVALLQAYQALETLIIEGWVEARYDPKETNLAIKPPSQSEMIHPHEPDEPEKDS